MPRPKGSKVVFCKQCRGRIVGMPRQRKKCPYCDAVNVIPWANKKDR